MKLRQWQADCIEIALTNYTRDISHFLALATPGAGKTMMASELAQQLLNNKLHLGYLKRVVVPRLGLKMLIIVFHL